MFFFLAYVIFEVPWMYHYFVFPCCPRHCDMIYFKSRTACTCSAFVAHLREMPCNAVVLGMFGRLCHVAPIPGAHKKKIFFFHWQVKR